jgi:hypothetical protein
MCARGDRRGDVDGTDDADGRFTFVPVEVDPAAVDAVTEVVRLFTVVVDHLDLSRDDMVTAGVEGGPTTVTMPDYLVPLSLDVAALAVRPEPHVLAPDEVTSDLLNQASLLATIKEGTDESFPHLEGLFARLGLPIDEPYTL